jgi:hypothetical protein
MVMLADLRLSSTEFIGLAVLRRSELADAVCGAVVAGWEIGESRTSGLQDRKRGWVRKASS